MMGHIYELKATPPGIPVPDQNIKIINIKYFVIEIMSLLVIGLIFLVFFYK